MKTLIVSSLLATALFSAGFSFLGNEDKAKKLTNIEKRWYSQNQVKKGKEIFAKNCASCHGYKAEKTIEWKKKLPNGSYPPPPLNDKAHAWHHPMWQLLKIIDNGGAAYGGFMPAFKNSLSYEEKKAAVAYFQSFWADEFYKIWLDNNGLKEKE